MKGIFGKVKAVVDTFMAINRERNKWRKVGADSLGQIPGFRQPRRKRFLPHISLIDTDGPKKLDPALYKLAKTVWKLPKADGYWVSMTDHPSSYHDVMIQVHAASMEACRQILKSQISVSSVSGEVFNGTHSNILFTPNVPGVTIEIRGVYPNPPDRGYFSMRRGGSYTAALIHQRMMEYRMLAVNVRTPAYPTLIRQAIDFSEGSDSGDSKGSSHQTLQTALDRIRNA